MLHTDLDKSGDSIGVRVSQPRSELGAADALDEAAEAGVTDDLNRESTTRTRNGMNTEFMGLSATPCLTMGWSMTA